MEAKLLTAERFVDTDLGCSYRYIHSSTEYFRPHYHDYYEIFVLIRGKVLHLINGEKTFLEPMHAVFIRPEDTHDFICKKDDSFSMLNITFTKEIAELLFLYLDDTDGLKRLNEPPLPPTVILNESEFIALKDKMTELRTLDTDKTRLKPMIRAFLLEFITKHFIDRHYFETSAEAPLWLKELRDRLREDNNFIEGISSISRLCDKSREHISRSMKRYYGITVSEYINDLRLNYIANMLLRSDHEILDIVFESGFNSVSWCYRCFEKKYGVSLSTYRNTGGSK